MIVDLRSDTRTLPDEQMRAAMANAEVGDDSFGDDPTVIELERRAAALTGTAAAVFTCGGTMSNLLAVLALAGLDSGARVITGAESGLTVRPRARPAGHQPGRTPGHPRRTRRPRHFRRGGPMPPGGRRTARPGGCRDGVMYPRSPA